MIDLLERLQVALAGRYAVERQIGRGGMATVYRARDVRHDRPVAIRVLHPELAAVIGTERFLREIRICAGLSHPHILPLYDSGEADGLLFFVMPLAEGESLRDRLAREKQFPLDDALRIAREVADALSYAHARGVVHRDIKPENILIEAGHAVVADFGIARAVSEAGSGPITQTGVSIGTPAYMSPEQASGRGDVDGRSDLYSLACVLHEMLAGQPPFSGVTVESLVRQHMTADPPDITRIRPGVPGEVASALTRALAKVPADRFNPVALFGEALGRRDQSPASRPPAAAASKFKIAAVAAAATAIVTAGWLAFRAGGAPAKPSSRVVAVLPLENLTADASHAYFASGLHDEILTQLSKTASLTVISRTSVMGYADKRTPLKQIAQDLGAGAVVEGTVQVAGTRLRVNVQLIDAATQAHLWAESYDRTLDDAFAIQSDVAQKIVTAVGGALTTGERQAIAATQSVNPEAYRLYLQGREFFLKPGRIRQNIEVSQGFFDRSIAAEPGYALAHASLSQAHSTMFWWRYDPSAARGDLAIREAESAVRLAPDQPQAHMAMGLALYRIRRDYRAALDEFAIALKGLPNDATLKQHIAAVQRRLGNLDETIVMYRQAAQLDPRDADNHADIGGTTFIFMRRYDEAEAALDKALAIAPDLHFAVVSKALAAFLRDGRIEALRAALQRLPADAPLGQMGVVSVQRAFASLWARDPDAVREIVATSPVAVFDGQRFYLPLSMFAGWASQMRGDAAGARASFESARATIAAAVARLPDDWRLHASHGQALAALGRRAEALGEAEWLRQSPVYGRDALYGPLLAEERARILAHCGEVDAAIDEIERQLTRPSLLTPQLLRLDPRWDPLRQHPRFKALLPR